MAEAERLRQRLAEAETETSHDGKGRAPSVNDEKLGRRIQTASSGTAG